MGRNMNEKAIQLRFDMLEHIAINAKELRKKHNRTLEEISEISGYSIPSLYSFECGKNDSATLYYLYNQMFGL